jgi:hypothetical protein
LLIGQKAREEELSHTPDDITGRDRGQPLDLGQ